MHLYLDCARCSESGPNAEHPYAIYDAACNDVVWAQACLLVFQHIFEFWTKRQSNCRAKSFCFCFYVRVLCYFQVIRPDFK